MKKVEQTYRNAILFTGLATIIIIIIIIIIVNWI